MLLMIVLKDVKGFIQESESMSEKINLSFLKISSNFHHQLIMQKCLLILVQNKTRK